jgi:hypothetical protein
MLRHLGETDGVLTDVAWLVHSDAMLAWARTEVCPPHLPGPRISDQHLGLIRTKLQAGRWRFSRPLWRTIRPGGKAMRCALQSLDDRLVVTALNRVLRIAWELCQAANTAGWRRGHGVHHAVAWMRSAEGDTFMERDVYHCFESVRHDRVLEQLATRVADPAILELVAHFCASVQTTPGVGVGRGTVLAPVLADIAFSKSDTRIAEFVAGLNTEILDTTTSDSATTGLAAGRAAGEQHCTGRARNTRPGDRTRIRAKTGQDGKNGRGGDSNSAEHAGTSPYEGVPASAPKKTQNRKTTQVKVERAKVATANTGIGGKPAPHATVLRERRVQAAATAATAAGAGTAATAATTADAVPTSAPRPNSAYAPLTATSHPKGNPVVSVLRFGDAYVAIGQSGRVKAVADKIESILAEDGLMVSPNKSCIAATESGFDFLKVRFHAQDGQLWLGPAEKWLTKFGRELDEKIKPDDRNNPELVSAKVIGLLSSRFEYFESIGASTTPIAAVAVERVDRWGRTGGVRGGRTGTNGTNSRRAGAVVRRVR